MLRVPRSPSRASAADDNAAKLHASQGPTRPCELDSLGLEVTHRGTAAPQTIGRNLRHLVVLVGKLLAFGIAFIPLKRSMAAVGAEHAKYPIVKDVELAGSP